ncbi:MAG: cytochrome b/b6 domain-containing protein [Acidobacteriota bacterium]|nr:cytochrome b/b6 domain-containing protein [Acidobacteriota bacterium]
MKDLEKKHPLAIRWFHWINFPLLAVMVWSGLLIYWANPVYRVGFGNHTLLKMTVAQKTYEKANLAFRLAEGLSLHFFFMWFFAINGILYVLYTMFSGEWRYLFPDRNSWVEAIQVTLHDLHLRKEPPPQAKYNAAQRISYTLIIVMGLGSLVTGLAIYKPVQFGWLTFLCGGYQMARFFHFWITVGYVFFFVVHVGQVIKTGWNNFRAMIIGREVRTYD